MIHTKFYSFHSVIWSIQSEDRELLERISCDYEHYGQKEATDTDFEILLDLKGNDLFPQTFMLSGKSYKFSLLSRHRLFKFDDNLFGFERSGKSRSLKIQGSNQKRLREVVLSYVNSVMGEILDLKGWHRLHAMAAVIDREAIVVPLNSNCGKSSFSFWILNNTQAKLLSDETVFTDGNYVKGFATRIALRKKPSGSFEIYRRSGEEKEKYLVGIADQQAMTSNSYRFRLWLPKNHWSRIGFLITFIFGLGSAQMMEFMIRPNNLMSLFKIFLSRIRLGIKLISRPYLDQVWHSEESKNFVVISAATNSKD